MLKIITSWHLKYVKKNENQTNKDVRRTREELTEEWECEGSPVGNANSRQLEVKDEIDGEIDGEKDGEIDGDGMETSVTEWRYRTK